MIDVSLMLSSKLLRDSVNVYKDEFMLTVKVGLADHLLSIKDKPYDLSVFDYIKEVYEKYQDIDDVVDCIIFILSCEVNYMCRTYAHRRITNGVSMQQAFIEIKNEIENYVGFLSEYFIEDFVWNDVDMVLINRVLQQIEFVARHRYELAMDMYRRLLCRWYGYHGVECAIRSSLLRMSEKRLEKVEARQFMCFVLKTTKVEIKTAFYTWNCSLIGFEQK